MHRPVRRADRPDGFFADLPRRCRADGVPLDESVREDLERGTEAAVTAYRRLGDDLRTHLLDRAPESDAAGRERYQLASRRSSARPSTSRRPTPGARRSWPGSPADMRRPPERILPGASVREAMDHLDRDPAYRLHGTEALRAWMQERADEVIAHTAGTHFDIPEPVRTIEARIAPTHTGGIYYTGPSDDFSRPGRMWWSVPRGSRSSAPGAS